MIRHFRKWLMVLFFNDLSNDLYEEARVKGYEEGYQYGYDLYEEARGEGYEEGYQYGYDEGFQQGYEQGEQDGYEAGLKSYTDQGATSKCRRTKRSV